MAMRTRGLCLLASLAVLTFSGCAANAVPEPAGRAFGVECPCCFTIVQSVRSGILPVQEHLHVQCERCCKELVFFATDDGRVLLADGDQAPVPAELAAPAR